MVIFQKMLSGPCPIIGEWLRLLAVCLRITSGLFGDFLQITCGILADYLGI